MAGPATFQPTVLGSGAPVAANPLRGQYRWMGYTRQPVRRPAPDIYYRDQTYWGRLERTKGVYDFSYIENGLKADAGAKGKFGFRVLPTARAAGWRLRDDQVSFPPVTPTYLPIQPGTGRSTAPTATHLDRPRLEQRGVPVPAWERPVGRAGPSATRNDPRLGYVDVGGYGKYGEWWVDRAP